MGGKVGAVPACAAGSVLPPINESERMHIHAHSLAGIDNSAMGFMIVEIVCLCIFFSGGSDDYRKHLACFDNFTLRNGK